ncbi:MAG TPA: L-serine ammonia-lyase, iron-sulfur-dependent, subunit alpha [archaeon]|nr:L-serine ammonia-lyase, iron-sulfur-dependent, subunit alpha [archaeon]HPV66180.1 L-serine ammonia-lyase, iron-sulfur-dependent, subunit alpha [archaeon]
MTEYILRNIVKLAKERKTTIAEIVKEDERTSFKRSDKEISNKLNNSINTFKRGINSGLKGHYKFKNLMFSSDSIKMANKKTRILGNTLHKACVFALAITENNLNMGTVIACPTAGSSGIVPGCIIAVAQDYNCSEKDIQNALLTAAAIELSIIKNASISGAVHGCQAECGSAVAMAAGAIIHLLYKDNTNPEMVENAAALALKNMLGLVCDPVAGIVSVPCRKRNATSVGVAFIAAQMALSGIKSYIPFDEVASAMDEIGKRMDEELKETARGGLANTRTGKKWETKKNKFLEIASKNKQSFADVLKNTKNEDKKI